MDISKYINMTLDSYRDSVSGKITNIPDKFVFAYGPYMCMRKGEYEKECDEIAQYNKYMSVMVHAAYLIRKITSGISYRDAKKTFKDFNLSVFMTFGNTGDTESDYILQALNSFSNNYLSKIRKDQKEKGELESFMTCASPIVPYQETIRRADQLDSAEEMTRADIANTIPKILTHSSVEKQIQELLLENLPEIMLNYNLCTVLLDGSQKTNLIKLDKLIMRDESVSIASQKYYFLATVHYYELYNTVNYDKYVKFFEEAGDFSKTQSYSAFEAMIDSMAKSTDIDIAAESWDDPTMDSKEEAAVSVLINSQKVISKIDEERPKYDFGILNDFINVKRFMKFEEFPNRLFVGSLEKSRIVNINNMGGDRNYYEMDNNTVACPFLDLRTFQPRVIVLYANTNEIGILDDFQDLY